MTPRTVQAERPNVKVRPADRAQSASDADPSMGLALQNSSLPNDSQRGASAEGDSIPQPRADDAWRRWIAENLIVGVAPALLLAAMTSDGFSSEEAANELKAAEDSPYVKGSELLRNRLNERDWLLAVYREHNRLDPESGEIAHRHRLTRVQLLRDYYSTNRPVIITGMIDDWPAMRNWSLDYFARTLGERQVEVRMPRTGGVNIDASGYEHYVGTISFGDFVEKMRAGDEIDDFDLTVHFGSANRKALSPLWDEIGQIPEYLATDRPGGMLKMAHRGTITPFQHDLANSLLAQVLGRTRLKIVPSWDIPFMYNHFHCFSRIDGRLVPSQTRPPFDEPQIHEVILERGELLFLPIGWLLHVEAIEISVTVSFTNFLFDNDYSSFYSTYGPV
jgi:hypothetical protein